MKTIIFVLATLFSMPAKAQCLFSTTDFIKVEDDGSWSRHISRDSITLEYSFGKISVKKKGEYYYIYDLKEIIDEFPVQKFLYEGWFVMVSNVNTCDWIAIANKDFNMIFINNQNLDYSKIVAKF